MHTLLVQYSSAAHLVITEDLHSTQWLFLQAGENKYRAAQSPSEHVSATHTLKEVSHIGLYGSTQSVLETQLKAMQFGGVAPVSQTSLSLHYSDF